MVTEAQTVVFEAVLHGLCSCVCRAVLLPIWVHTSVFPCMCINLPTGSHFIYGFFQFLC